MFNKQGETAAAELLNSQYREITASFSEGGRDIIVAYIGEMTQDKIGDIAIEAEAALQKHGVTKNICKKVFNLVIETLQNIKAHGEKSSEGSQYAYFIIGKDKEKFSISSGNLMPTAQIENLKKKIDDIKKLDEKALKGLYLKVLDNGEMSEKGGAGLGILTIALKSGNNIDYSVDKVDDTLSVFKLQSKVFC